MITSIATSTLLEEADLLGAMILESEPFQAYLQCRGELELDNEAQALIRQFNDLKLDYEDVQRFGKYHPDYDKVSTEIRQLKRTLDLHPTVVAFKKAEKELETLLNEISGMIAHAVSHTIKVPTGNPFFDSMSCSGGCGSGGGCSCSA
ncbi:YlbF family regulator [Halalkalibacterium ligniniphilum]|uniref:YlbF family regulator n=1 Tax=Halalkalibacterium ligniniphilum TaxID=1134413 RepID=UPI000348DDAB|nr:YlbF family regulator [Halalkalibacterium ligniniphilum]